MLIFALPNGSIINISFLKIIIVIEWDLKEMIGVYVVWKKVKNWVISTPTWYVVCEINNKTCLNKWKCHKVDIRVIFSIFFFMGSDWTPVGMICM